MEMLLAGIFVYLFIMSDAQSLRTAVIFLCKLGLAHILIKSGDIRIL